MMLFESGVQMQHLKTFMLSEGQRSQDLLLATSDIDPMLGRECFESRRASLPAGTQYEGIESAAGNRITIRIMNGVDVTTLDCELNPDGTLQAADE